MNVSDVLIITLVIVGLVVAGLFYLNKKSMRKMVDAQDFIDQNGMVVQIFVLDKKQEKPTPENMQKGVYELLPKTTKMRKANIIKAKVEGRIVTLMCDKSVYEVLVPKKKVKVELAGIYIVSIVGMNLENKKNKSFSEKMSVQANKGLKK